jgi:hypothetical protein
VWSIGFKLNSIQNRNLNDNACNKIDYGFKFEEADTFDILCD